MTLSAKFGRKAFVAPAIEALVAAGCERSSIETYSNEPVELPGGVLDHPSRISLFAVLAAILNGSLATVFMLWTQHDYPLPTGGMPISSGWATGVITLR